MFPGQSNVQVAENRRAFKNTLVSHVSARPWNEQQHSYLKTNKAGPACSKNRWTHCADVGWCLWLLLRLNRALLLIDCWDERLSSSCILTEMNTTWISAPSSDLLQRLLVPEAFNVIYSSQREHLGGKRQRNVICPSSADVAPSQIWSQQGGSSHYLLCG